METNNNWGLTDEELAQFYKEYEEWIKISSPNFDQWWKDLDEQLQCEQL